MSLLVIDRVTKTLREGTRMSVALREVTLEIDAGEYVVVWGLRCSGRSTLMRIAAGVEEPDRGVVRFEGHDLRERDVLGEGIGFCQKRFGSDECPTVLDQVMMGLLARGIAQPVAGTLATAALERCGALGLARASTASLDEVERVCVAIARVLTHGPRLLVIDEPTNGVELLKRDSVLGLLRSIADDGTAVLASAGDATELSGADRTLALSDGELRGEIAPMFAEVVPLRRTA
jgi:ABC-type sugar transport system ATPase subunit